MCGSAGQNKHCSLLILERQQQRIPSQSEAVAAPLWQCADRDLTSQGIKALKLSSIISARLQACQYDGCRLQSLDSWGVTPRLHALYPGHNVGILCCGATIDRVSYLQTQRLHAVFVFVALTGFTPPCQ